MAQAQVYAGTPDQLARQLSKLPSTQKYQMTIIPEEPEVKEKTPQMMTFGMFPQLQALTEEDFRSAEWRGEDIDL